MGFGVSELLILLLIVALLFGTKKLRNMGSDLGSAVKGFRSAVSDNEDAQPLSADTNESTDGQVIEGEIQPEQEKADK